MTSTSSASKNIHWINYVKAICIIVVYYENSHRLTGGRVHELTPPGRTTAGSG